MATTIIKSTDSDNQAIVNSDGRLLVSGDGGSGSNASVGLIGDPAPTSGTEIAGVNPDGILTSIAVDDGGNLSFSSSGTISSIITLVYNEITSVAVGIEVIVLSYVVINPTAQLINIAASGQNIGEVRVYKNTSVIDKQYLTYTAFNLNFDFKNVGFATGDVISIKAVNSGQDLCNFNANIKIIEIP